jgi:hypothetical protein
LNQTPFERLKVAGTTTGEGQLFNPKDKKGYRLSGWVKEQPGLFD